MKIKMPKVKNLGIVGSIAVALLAIFFFTSCAQREVKNIDSSGTNIICFGDSITFGYGADHGEDYPSVLSRMISIPVINAGIDGDTSSEAVRRLESDVLRRDPLLVVIEFGGNDFLRKIPIEETFKNIRIMIDRIHASGAMVAITDISAGILLSNYRKQFQQLANEKNAIFIPSIFSGIITNPSLRSDMIHPNADGYKIIAQRVYRAILPYLNQNSMVRRYRKLP